tara:strand:- start:770 stop:895 length:126 start_codon:yes stop_codon:yes gene_type:complete
MNGIGQQVDEIERVFQDSNEYELKKSFILLSNQLFIDIKNV